MGGEGQALTAVYHMYQTPGCLGGGSPHRLEAGAPEELTTENNLKGIGTGELGPDFEGLG